MPDKNGAFATSFSMAVLFQWHPLDLLPTWLPTSTKLVITLYFETCDSLSNLVERQTLDSKVTQRGSEDSRLGTHTQNMMTKAFFP